MATEIRSSNGDCNCKCCQASRNQNMRLEAEYIKQRLQYMLYLGKGHNTYTARPLPNLLEKATGGAS